MRLGILDLGYLLPSLPNLVGGLQAVDVDVIVAEESPPNERAIWNEAQRLARADCDGILLLVSDSAPVPYLLPAQVAVYLPGVPFLIMGGPAHHGAQAVGALREVGGVSFDVLHSDSRLPILAWLQENDRRERQRGLEAAQKLYGKRFVVPSGVDLEADPFDWLRRFGILITQGEVKGGDIAVPDGDLTHALTAELMHLVSGEVARRVSITDVEETPGEQTITLLRIESRKDSFAAVVLPGKHLDEYNAVAYAATETEARLLSDSAYAVPGKHIGALRAALLAFDITM